MSVETVIVKTANGPVMINKSDYDPAMHELENPADMPLPVVASNVVPVQPGVNDVSNNSVQLRTDGPTIAEYVSAGYDPVNYPPNGYESRSTPEEITAAIEAKQQTPPNEPATAPAMFVTKKGKKFIVTDKDGKPVERDDIEANGYPDEAAAWAAIVAASSPKTA